VIRASSIVALAVSLGACSFDVNGRNHNGNDLAGNIVSYSCNNSRSFTAAYDSDMKHVSIGGSGDSHRLALQGRQGDSWTYAGKSGNGSTTHLVVRGEEATLGREGESDLEGCVARS